MAAIEGTDMQPGQPRFSDLTFEELRSRFQDFATAREWDQFHTPRNLTLALVGEVGELAELFQWRFDSGAPPALADWKEKDRVHLGEELSDVLLYLVRLADRCNIDLPAAVQRKMALNAAKYPADQARGRSDKYSAYAAQKEAHVAAVASAVATTTTEAAVEDASASGKPKSMTRWLTLAVGLSVIALAIARA